MTHSIHLASPVTVCTTSMVTRTVWAKEEAEGKTDCWRADTERQRKRLAIRRSPLTH